VHVISITLQQKKLGELDHVMSRKIVLSDVIVVSPSEYFLVCCLFNDDDDNNNNKLIYIAP